MVLGPPLAATMFKLVFVVADAHPFNPVAPHESFHGTSGMYPIADACVLFVLAEFQKVLVVFTSSKSVPPTATLNGVDAVPLIAMPCVALFSLFGLSHPADPLSPDETETVIPSAAACCHSPLMNVLFS